ncbi:superfamily II DNA/RNA helicase [Clostridium punense]|uniref:Superfamily II DNA/RNA helicase n=1 Tax=Clostridium punense TaxID=1054297 RepID=A0ABS4K3H7_9CLOT|nr:DEAD/DEAH box helicase [Clostridium punense]MBP2022342.1 superfamily II DNA/RNA helicase [Clostridium punense]
MNKKTFEDFNLNPNIIKSVKLLGYENPSPVQSEVIPTALKGQDVIVKAQTGSGKTAAFAIPILENLEIEKNAVQALVLTPTRELAVQVTENFSTLGLYKRINAVSIYGKQPISIQKTKLSQRVHVVVGTPGRTMDHITKGTLNLEQVRYLVIDEADEMLNMGFIEQVEDIIKKVPKARQTLMFSATLSEEIQKHIVRYMKNPEVIEITPDKLTVEKINQRCYFINEIDKYKLLKDLITVEAMEKCILFCRTKKNVSDLASKMRASNYSVTEIHGDMVQQDRLSALKAFKEGEYSFIVATDVASRGIDVTGVSHVINYDIPLELEAYVHRIGRTGRAGNLGEAITFVTPYEEKFLKSIEEFIGMEIPRATPPSKEEIEKAPQTQVRPIIKKTNTSPKEVLKLYINAGKKKKIRRGDIVGALINSGNIPSESIGVIEVFDNYSHVDILNGDGPKLLKTMKELNLKGKPTKIQRARNN